MRVVTREIGSIPGCVPMPHDKSFLDILGIGVESIADQYCDAVRRFRLARSNREHLVESEALQIMKHKKVR
jgi:hypothetical protein